MKKIIILVSALTVLWSCKEDQPEPAEPVMVSTVTFDFDHVVDATDLQLESGSYTNSLGQAYSVSSWKYFISNIQFYKNGTLVYAEKDSYHYINEADDESMIVELLAVPDGEYDEIRFAFGIDSLHNSADSTNGEIDPSTGMLWPMNGYRFSNFDGLSGSAGLAFHVGGNSNYKPLIFNSISVKVLAGSKTAVHYVVNLNKMFSSVNVIDFTATQSLASESGSKPIAENIANGMFVIDDIDNP